MAEHEFQGLSTRQGFNRSLRHFKIVTEIVAEFEEHTNLADVLNDLLEKKRIEQVQVASIVSALLVDKYRYRSRSYNMREGFSEFKILIDTCTTWTSVDLLVAYMHPELGFLALNPKTESHWNDIEVLKGNELVVLFSGAFQDVDEDKRHGVALETLVDLLEGKKVKTATSLTKTDLKARAASEEEPVVEEQRPTAAAKKAEPAGAPPAKRRMTPLYSIPVTNELFHNGNVEAWKRVIESYETKYPGNEVAVFYDGERIHDINSLFKWGKVKHGSSILISVAGDDIKDVAKLRRYLNQGASPGFEAFLKFPVGQVLNLF